MAILSVPETGLELREPLQIKSFLAEKGVFFDQWTCEVQFADTATQDEILAAYAKDLQPFMQAGGYQSADVISINALTPNYDQIRAKFLAEHTHDEDEIRFFVDGQGLFWFHLENTPVFNVLCQRGDLISVPIGTKHWFDAGATDPFVKAIRIFTDTSGCTTIYTQSCSEQQ
ncbi:MAG: 1,2-dihydroxy-3-keto-5-methylthiopentene dioxygenase, partial [Sphingomonadales bacterium]